MKTVSGALFLSKTEIKELEILIQHMKANISYGGGGTFWTGEDKNGEHVFDQKNAIKAANACDTIEEIIKIAR
jgi:hypothetical protein